jgi:hypothetical protein
MILLPPSARRRPVPLLGERPIAPARVAPGTPRVEPYGFPLKEGFFFKPTEVDFLDQFCGYHDYAVQLNLNLTSLHDLAHGCRHGWHPITRATSIQTTGLGSPSLPFPDALRGAVPNFLLGVWELALNGWQPLAGVHDPLVRFLLSARQGRPITSGPAAGLSATEAIFHCAFLVAGLLERHPALSEGLDELRCRHRALHAVEPWCWWRPVWNAAMLSGIVQLLRGELETLNDEPERREQVERWYKAALWRWGEVVNTTPRFDWLVPTDSETGEVAEQLLHTLAGYDGVLLVQELMVEYQIGLPRLLAEVEAAYFNGYPPDISEEGPAPGPVPPAPSGVSGGQEPDPFLDFPRRQRLLLLALTGKGKVPRGEVLLAVYPKNGQDRSDAFHKLITRTNAALAREGLGCEIKGKGDAMWLADVSTGEPWAPPGRK